MARLITFHSRTSDRADRCALPAVDRWGYRLLVYMALMTDRYPPFRLDQGSIDIEGPAQPPEPSQASQ
jgi:hypothetical protein